MSYRKDSSIRVKKLDLTKVQQPEPSVLDTVSAAAYITGVPTSRSLPAISGSSLPSNAISASRSVKLNTNTSRAEAQLGTSSAERHVVLSAKYNAFHTSAAKQTWPPSPAIPSPQQTSRLTQQPTSWQLTSAAGTAHHAGAPNSSSLAAKSWQQQLTTASAHEQWVAHKHTPHGRTSDPGNAEGWGELLVRVPKQAGNSTEELMQQLPQALAGGVHTQTALQVWPQRCTKFQVFEPLSDMSSPRSIAAVK